LGCNIDRKGETVSNPIGTNVGDENTA
jgi:hypothetical protein